MTTTTPGAEHPVYAVVELVGISSESWEKAAATAIAAAARSLRDLRVARVVGLDVRPVAGGGLLFRTRLMVSFKYETSGLDPCAAAPATTSRTRRTIRLLSDRPVGWLAGSASTVARPLYRVLWPVRVIGFENVPREGPAIIAANHVSFFDSVALIMAVRRPLSFVGKAEYLNSWKTRHLLPALGMIPVDRQSARQAVGALQIAASVLARSGLFAIFPEGTRSRDGALAAGHTGVAHIAVASGAPIIPTGIVGTAEIQPPDARVPRPFRPAEVRFGRPIEPASYSGGRRTRRRAITGDVMEAIRVLSGQEQRTTGV